MNKLKFALQLALVQYVIKWLFICLIIGLMAGSASALFLVSLKTAGDWRENNPWLIALLPIGGLVIGLAYH